MKNIHAHTETHTTPPGYISINDDAGRLTVSVRSRGGQTAGMIELNRDQLAATAPAPEPVKVEAKPTAKAEAKGKA